MTLTHGGDPNAVIGNGWEALGKSIDLKAGKTKAAVPLDGLMRGKAGEFPADEDFPPLRAPSIITPVDTRYLYPNLARAALGPELSVAEFRQVGSAEVASGNVLRYPTDAPKGRGRRRARAGAGEGAPGCGHDLKCAERDPRGRDHAAGVPAGPAAHQARPGDRRTCVAAIDAASFHGGAVGADLVAQIRNGIAAMNSLGTNPTIVALSPTDSVELDLFTTGADDAYAFALRDSGSSSPLFGLRVIETPAVTNPLLIDPPALGLLYVGQARFEVDPYSGFTENLSTVRLEGNVLFHVRNAQGVYEIGGS